jgi:DNA-binding NarL/FixJ family response regulator
MLTRQEREQAVLDLYNQGKTIRDIAREVRISFRDIGVVLKKEEEKMEKEKQRTRFENNMTSTEGDNS